LSFDLLRLSRSGKISGGFVERLKRTAWLAHTSTATAAVRTKLSASRATEVTRRKLRRQTTGSSPSSCTTVRRVNATALVAERIDVKTAQARLGHSNPRLTLAIYSQSTEAADKAAAAALGLSSSVCGMNAGGGPPQHGRSA
jgi:integrase